jgi:hypothetical protein
MIAPMPAEKVDWLRRIGWLVLIWTASVVSLAAAAVLFRVMMNIAGLTARHRRLRHQIRSRFDHDPSLPGGRRRSWKFQPDHTARSRILCILARIPGSVL